jgi:lysine-specific demethylase 8
MDRTVDYGRFEPGIRDRAPMRVSPDGAPIAPVVDDAQTIRTRSCAPLVPRPLAGDTVYPLFAIPEVDRWLDVAEDARTRLVPVVIRGLFAAQAAAWSPARLAELWPDRQVRVTVDLPSHSVPYREQVDPFQRVMALAEFLAMLDSGRSCYLAQTPLALFPDIHADMRLRDLHLGIVFATNLWVGSKTRSGLHYDNADNLFAQIHGRKRALLISPKDSRFLYPFSDSPSKSQVDLDSPDLNRHPRCARAEVWSCDLCPGDALFMPRGWWHHIRSEEVSMSINCWHGESLTELERAKRFFGSGPKVLFRMVWDFLWHGLLRRPYRQRLFSPPPPGVEAYQRLRGQLR